MAIDKNIPLKRGMEISYGGKCWKINKVGRKYAYILRCANLPGIDQPSKVLISRIYRDFTLPRKFVPPKKEWLKK